MYIPSSTYRIQFHKGFRFSHLRELVPYLSRLGISAVYASPIFTATPGSTHGYDVCNPSEINPEIGTEAELRELKELLRRQGIGWVQDIVPNHMAYAKGNTWLQDLFSKGEASEYYNSFDINWEYFDPEWQGSVMAPVLGKELEQAVEENEVQLAWTDKGAAVKYFDHQFPLLQNGGNGIRAEDVDRINADRKELLRILGRQKFRFCHWKTTLKEINYRRFFTINGLICLSMERDEVFSQYHSYLLKLLKEGIFDGLRIDHIDGLLHPAAYLQKLRKEAGGDTYIVVEKILEADESLPAWPVQGTTGYDFLGLLNRLLTSGNQNKLQEIYSKFTGHNEDIEELAYEAKYHILSREMGGELTNLSHLAADVLDLPTGEIKPALAALLAAFPVYRVYPAEGQELTTAEKEYIEAAFVKASEKEPQTGQLLDKLKNIFLNAGTQHVAFLQRFQQLAGPLAAKGIEDTLYYRYQMLISHNEVGDSPLHIHLPVQEFHTLMQQRQQQWPLAVNASSSHDTKRGEDARMRLNVLAEMPEEWEQMVKHWQRLSTGLKSDGQPDAATEYLIYQALIAAWEAHDPTLPERFTQYLSKALREAKIHTNWADVNEEYENAVTAFAESLLQKKDFMDSFIPFAEKVAFSGCMKSLSQLVLKIFCPGVPDIYQGTELWDLSMVDPDNRRPVDYELRKKMLEDMDRQPGLQQLMDNCKNGKIKLFTLVRCLNERKAFRDIHEAEYIPLEIKGRQKERLIAFLRTKGNRNVLVLAPLFSTGMAAPFQFPLGQIWEGASLNTGANTRWKDIFTGNTISGSELPVADLLAEFPVAVLTSIE